MRTHPQKLPIIVSCVRFLVKFIEPHTHICAVKSRVTMLTRYYRHILFQDFGVCVHIV